MVLDHQRRSKKQAPVERNLSWRAMGSDCLIRPNWNWSRMLTSEMKRANVRNDAFVRRVIEMKRMIVNSSFAESFVCIQIILCPAGVYFSNIMTINKLFSF